MTLEVKETSKRCRLVPGTYHNLAPEGCYAVLRWSRKISSESGQKGGLCGLLCKTDAVDKNPKPEEK